MQTLFALGRSLTEVLDLSEVLNRVVEAARHLTNAEEGMILLPDGQTGQLYLRAKVGIDLEVADNFRIKTHDTIAGSVFESGQPMLVGESGPQKVKTEYFVNSLLYVPIIHKGQTLGVLGVNNKDKHDVFTERHRDLLVNLATYAAIAIENARIHGQSIRRTHELKALIDASQAINASLSFDHDAARDLRAVDPRAERGTRRNLHLGSRRAAASVCWRAVSRRCWRDGHAAADQAGGAPAGAAGHRKPAARFRPARIARDIAEQERFKQIGASASLVLPIFGGDQMLGVVQAYYVHNPETRAVGRGDSRARSGIVLEGLANLAGDDDYTHALQVA